MNKIRRILIIAFFACITKSVTYGQINFMAGSQFNPGFTYGTLKDSRDSVVYKTLKIGSQTWMAENLRYKPSGGSFAFDNTESIAERFGRLYDWQTASTVCPCGWHLPGNEEWARLISFLGGDNIAGKLMKSATGWANTNEPTTNSIGFSALPSGYRHDDGTFGSLGANANFWSGTPIDSMIVWGRNLNYLVDKVALRQYSRTNFYSVRCIKD